MRHPRSPIFEHHPTPTDTSSAHHPVKMRTYDDSFSGQKIYPGKVRSITPSGPNLQEEEVVFVRIQRRHHIPVFDANFDYNTRSL